MNEVATFALAAVTGVGSGGLAPVTAYWIGERKVRKDRRRARVDGWRVGLEQAEARAELVGDGLLEVRFESSAWFSSLRAVASPAAIAAIDAAASIRNEEWEPITPAGLAIAAEIDRIERNWKLV